MSKPLAVAIIHGMGTQHEPGFESTCQKLMDSVRGYGVHVDDIAYKGIYWAHVLNKRQEEYWAKAQASGAFDTITARLAWNDLREFVVDYLADVTAYQRVSQKVDHDERNAASGTYVEIHRIVQSSLAELRAEAGADVPLIVLAHSLGGHIMSNYVWDIQVAKPVVAPGASGLERMDTLAGMITFGCNIPLFTFAYRPQDIKPIAFPGRALAADQKAKAKWINVYDPDDVLGYPLNTLDSYQQAGFCEDRKIDAGGALVSWNPASHTGYWEDDDFHRIVADYLKAFQ